MKMKKEYIFLAVIIVALALYIALKNTDGTHYTLPELKTIQKEDVDKILITRGDSTINISRSSGKWKIMPARYKADSKEVDQILDELKDLTITTLVSESETYKRYGLTADERIYARAFEQDKALRQFYIGKNASTRRHTYIMLPGDPRVYQVRNNIRRMFDKSVDDLRDKVVLTFEATAATGLVMNPAEGEELVLERKMVPLPVEPAEEEEQQSENQQMEAKWMTGDGRTAKAESIKSILRTLSNLKCSGYLEGKSKKNLTDPVYTITVKLNNQAHSVSLFEKNDDNLYPGVSTGSDYPFLLSEWRANQIMKDPGELLVEEKD
ncbi:MAG: DUF4340 domain-containing protein [Candidatus Krumholzibacteriales bacterium]